MNSSTFDLSQKTAIVTGASRGIGEAIAWSYARAGANVVLSSRRAENIMPVADAINEEFSGRALALAVHAGNLESAGQLVEKAVEHFGSVDIVVNNAGTNPHFGPILSADESHWDKIFEVNVKGCFWMCQAAARQMIAQGSGGKIINNASVAGLRPGLMMGVYSVSKAAVIMLTRSLALELGRENIQVNAIAPGYVKTRFTQVLWSNDKLNEGILEQTPAGRMGDPEEIAGIALYLASSVSDFTTGAVFTIDGGYSL